MTEEKSLLDLATSHISQEQQNAEQEGSVPKRPDMASNQHKNSDEIKNVLESLLAKANLKKGWVRVKIPTMGYLNPECDGTVEIRSFTFEDEKRLRSVMGLQEGVDVITDLMKSCVKGIEYSALSLIDKAYILFKLRELSYGNDYTVEASCRHCGDVNELTVELDKIPVNYANSPMEDPKAVNLPDSEVVAYLKYPRVKDETVLSELQTLMDNLWRFVAKVEEHTERAIIQQFISKTTAKDVTVIRQALFDQKIGLQTNVRFKCRKCGADEVVDLPMNENFFSVN